MFSNNLNFQVNIASDFNFQVFTSDTVYLPTFVIWEEINFGVAFTNDISYTVFPELEEI